MVRAYDTSTWVEDTTLSFSTASTGKGAVGMGMDRRRGIIYWGSMNYGAYVPPYSGSPDLYKYDLATMTITHFDVGSPNDGQVVDVSVDEDTGLVYITETSHMSVWDTSVSPWNMLQRHSFGTHPATCGIAVTNVSYMPNLAVDKVDDVADGECVSVRGRVTYTVSYENTGDTDLTGVTIVDTLPPEVDVDEGTIGAGVYNSTGHTVTWDIGDLAVEASGSVTFSVDMNENAVAGSTIINYATIDSNETNVTTVQENTDICENMPPVAQCQDVTVEAEGGCQGCASVDDESYDPDGDGDIASITEDPGCPYELGDTTVTLTIEDLAGETDSCTGVVSVVDTTPPVIQCNAPVTIIPPDAPISFAATATDDCNVEVVITGYRCWAINGAGKEIDKGESCVVTIDGDTVTIVDSGGVGDNIEWTVEATDGSMNVTTQTCGPVEVINPTKEK
jgi:uncharacterized repeat protein (TIGR01451 family)